MGTPYPLLRCLVNKTRRIWSANPSIHGSLEAARCYGSESLACRKVAILGAAGRAGQNLALLLKTDRFIAKLALYDISPDTPRVASYVSHIPTKAQVSAYVGEDQLGEALDGSDVVVITAAPPQKPGTATTDDDDANASIWRSLCTAATKHCPQAKIIIATRPELNPVPVAWEVLNKAGITDQFQLIALYVRDDDHKDNAPTAQGDPHFQLVQGTHAEALPLALMAALSVDAHLKSLHPGTGGFPFFNSTYKGDVRSTSPRIVPKPEVKKGTGDSLLEWFKEARNEVIQRRSRQSELSGQHGTVNSKQQVSV